MLCIVGVHQGCRVGTHPLQSPQHHPPPRSLRKVSPQRCPPAQLEASALTKSLTSPKTYLLCSEQVELKLRFSIFFKSHGQ